MKKLREANKCGCKKPFLFSPYPADTVQEQVFLSFFELEHYNL